MKKFYFFVLSLVCFSAAAQNEFGGKSVSIAPLSSGNLDVAPSGASISKPDIFDAKPSASLPQPEATRQFGVSETFANPNDKYVENLNKKPDGERDEAIRKNQYLGDVRTNASTVRIRYRDHEFPDGDLIKILINDKVRKPGVLLESDFESFELKLEPGFNKIDFEALNQGTSGPNTAEFEIFDEKGTLISSNRWNLATGFKATIIVVKE